MNLRGLSIYLEKFKMFSKFLDTRVVGEMTLERMMSCTRPVMGASLAYVISHSRRILHPIER